MKLHNLLVITLLTTGCSNSGAPGESSNTVSDEQPLQSVDISENIDPIIISSQGSTASADQTFGPEIEADTLLGAALPETPASEPEIEADTLIGAALPETPASEPEIEADTLIGAALPETPTSEPAISQNETTESGNDSEIDEFGGPNSSITLTSTLEPVEEQEIALGPVDVQGESPADAPPVETLGLASAQCEMVALSDQILSSWNDEKVGSSAPVYKTSVTEQSSMSVVSRASSNDVWGVSNGRAIHQYSKIQAFNADDTLIDVGDRIVHADTLDLVGGIIPITSARNWSNIDPDIMYGIYFNPLPNELVRLNIETNQIDLVGKFDGFTDCTIGDFEGSISDDDRFILLACTNSSTSQRTLISYDILNQTILGQLNAKSNFNWGSFSPSGEFILVENNRYPDSNPQILRYSPNLTEETLIASEAEHGDFGYDDNGDEVYVMMLNDFFYYRLKDGERVQMTVAADIGIGWGHLSCRATQRPGWCYYTATQNSLVGAVKISATAGEVEHWGFHRSSYNSYEATPKGTVNRTGDKVLFTSNWYESSEINDYLMTCSGQ